MPQTFTDNTGRKWTLELTLGRAREIRGKLNLDVFNESDWQILMSSILDRLTYAFYVVKDQALELGVTIDDFEAAVMGDGVSDQVSDALVRELVFFYSALGQVKLSKLTKAFLAGTEKEREKFATIDFDKMLEVTMSTTPG